MRAAEVRALPLGAVEGLLIEYYWGHTAALPEYHKVLTVHEHCSRGVVVDYINGRGLLIERARILCSRLVMQNERRQPRWTEADPNAYTHDVRHALNKHRRNGRDA